MGFVCKTTHMCEQQLWEERQKSVGNVLGYVVSGFKFSYGPLEMWEMCLQRRVLWATKRGDGLHTSQISKQMKCVNVCRNASLCATLRNMVQHRSIHHLPISLMFILPPPSFSLISPSSVLCHFTLFNMFLLNISLLFPKLHSSPSSCCWEPYPSIYSNCSHLSIFLCPFLPSSFSVISLSPSLCNVERFSLQDLCVCLYSEARISHLCLRQWW